MSRYITVITAFIMLQLPCAISSSVQKRVDYLKWRHLKLYGDSGSLNHRELNMDSLVFPRGDKQKLAAISTLWSDHYQCQQRQIEQLTRSRRLPSDILAVYQGTVARLPCRLCIAPGEISELRWVYTKSIVILNFTRLEDKDRVVRERDGNITIYHVITEDAGVYRCQIGDSVGGVMVLEVVDTDNYTVKPPTSHGPYPSPPAIINGELTAFTSWSEWSDCSVCGMVGRRRRVGMCYVQMNKQTDSMKEAKELHKITIETTNGIINRNIRTTFEDFPFGIPCRSQYLPLAIRSTPAARGRPNEIMIGMCKIPCKTRIFRVESRDAMILERTNNSAGVYSFVQTLPPQPPLPVRDIVFATYEDAVVIRCPGTTLRDVPVCWRVGTKHVVPRELDRSSEGRIHINARDHVLISKVHYEDGNLYSCWQRGNLAGTVRLVIWESARTHWERHAILLAAAMIAIIFLRIYLPTVLGLEDNALYSH